jgi:hypothetical protein
MDGGNSRKLVYSFVGKMDARFTWKEWARRVRRRTQSAQVAREAEVVTTSMQFGGDDWICAAAATGGLTLDRRRRPNQP